MDIHRDASEYQGGIYVCLNFWDQDCNNVFKVGKTNKFMSRLAQYCNKNSMAHFIYTVTLSKRDTGSCETATLNALRRIPELSNLSGPGGGYTEAFRGDWKLAIPCIEYITRNYRVSETIYLKTTT
jgi:hypothetical protein